jgi:hypothetical protein
MELNQTVRDVLEIGIGLVYLVGAIFNSAYTFRHGNEFYGGFAEGAWFAPSRKFVRNVVIPRSKVFTSLLIIFQLLVAFAILTRGPYVVYGLYAGVIFNLGAAVVSSIAGTLVNLVLAAVQFLLAYSA